MKFIQETTSTNDVLKELIKSKNCANICSIYSFSQTKGRGRNNRFFESNKGGLYYSIAVKESDIIDKTNIITHIIGLEICKTIEDFFGKNVGIKWVNDIIYNGKKCAGILTERTSGYIIIGIGINIFNKIGDHISNIAISLEDKKEINEDLLHYFAKLLDRNIKNMLTSPLDANWNNLYNKKSIIISKKVKILKPNKDIIAQGVALLVDDNGNVVIEDKNGDKLKFASGELSLRF